LRHFLNLDSTNNSKLSFFPLTELSHITTLNLNQDNNITILIPPKLRNINLSSDFTSLSLLKKINESQSTILNPLNMVVTDVYNKKYNHIAINEVALLRQNNQASKIQIEINNHERLSCLIADGVLLSTSAGSTAYNLSAGGPIIPFGAKILALTAISPFRPRKWNGALLPANSKVKFKILDHENRPVSATADYIEVRNVIEVEVFEDKNKEFKILFDSNHSLEERIIREQFVH
jgi:NAD+ kinase